MSEASVLYDAPGPRARRRNTILTVVTIAVFVVIAYVVYRLLDQEDQFAARLWTPFLDPQVWTGFVLPGLVNTLKSTLVAGVLALVFGMVFGLARLSDHWWIRVPAGLVVEFFRAIPLLILIFLALFVPPIISPIIAQGPLGMVQRYFVEYLLWPFGVQINGGVVIVPAFAALVFGLVLYNGSVLAEVVRAGVLAVPRGQSEAAYSIGLRKNAVTRLVLLPQAITAMMPAIVAQMVVLLKDSALGFIIAYEELLNNMVKKIPANFGNNVLQSAIVCALIYILLNLALGRFATWLERRNARRGRTAAVVQVGQVDAVDAGAAGAAPVGLAGAAGVAGVAGLGGADAGDGGGEGGPGN